jgi:hypothetical protein
VAFVLQIAHCVNSCRIQDHDENIQSHKDELINRLSTGYQPAIVASLAVLYLLLYQRCDAELRRLGMAKKSRKKSSRKAAPPSTLSVKLSRAQQARAQQCLERSGRIRLSIKQVSLTKLPKTLPARMVFTD